MKLDHKNRGFTLIELLIVIAVIAILASVVFVALDPLTRFQDARDSSRWNDIAAIMSAIKVDQVDNGGPYVQPIVDVNDTSGTGPLGVNAPAYEEIFMIGEAGGGSVTTACSPPAVNCPYLFQGTLSEASPAGCVDLSGLVSEGYMGEIPVSPSANGTWDSDYTGYFLMTTDTGSIMIGACEPENEEYIQILQ